MYIGIYCYRQFFYFFKHKLRSNTQNIFFILHNLQSTSKMYLIL